MAPSDTEFDSRLLQLAFQVVPLLCILQTVVMSRNYTDLLRRVPAPQRAAVLASLVTPFEAQNKGRMLIDPSPTSPEVLSSFDKGNASLGDAGVTPLTTESLLTRMVALEKIVCKSADAARVPQKTHGPTRRYRHHRHRHHPRRHPPPLTLK